MRNFYQSNTACSIEADKSIGHQIIIKHENNNMSCSFSSKTKSKSNLPIPLVVSHQSLLPSQDQIHKRKLKINHLANFNTSLSPTSSLQTKLLNMNNNNVCLSLRPNLNNQTDNNYHLLPDSSSSSSSLSTSLSIEPMFISEQFQQQQLRKENKFIIKKNSSLSSKTSSSSSSAYSSFGSTASSPAPSPNSSNYNSNLFFVLKYFNFFLISIKSQLNLLK